LAAPSPPTHLTQAFALFVFSTPFGFWKLHRKVAHDLEVFDCQIRIEPVLERTTQGGHLPGNLKKLKFSMFSFSTAEF
jgi:hypothetical protein